MLVKICGLKESGNLESVSKFSPDFIGLIFYDKSPRFVNGALLEKQVRTLPGKILPTGVFVNESVNNILSFVKRYGLKAVQLHGAESADFCRELGDHLDPDFLILKAFGLYEGFDFSILFPYQHLVNYFLFDTQSPVHGGTGKKFDWTLLEGYTLDNPYFLSGGIGLEEISALKEEIKEKSYFKHLAGLDLNSRLEDSPGMKNLNKVRMAIEEVKNLIN